MSNKVVVVGAGWLGEATGQMLLSDQWNVQMTSRDNSKAEQNHWALFDYENGELQHSVSLQQAVWLFCIPAGRTAERQDAYRSYLNAAIRLAKQLKMKAFILCSSTGVYDDTAGIYRESDVIEPKSERQSRLLANEALVTPLGSMGKVLRLAGLYGPKRHPGRFFEHKTPRSNGAETVNMLHQTEAVNGIKYIVEHVESMPQIINLVTPDHPNKAEFYQHAALSLGLPAPEFSCGEPTQRIISSQVLTQLGYQFRFSTLKAALQVT